MITYCRTIIKVPTARKAMISFGATSQVQMWINEELIADSVAEKLELTW